MKIPKKLKVGAHTFTVRLAKARDHQKGPNYWGKTNYDSNTITVDNEITPTMMEEVFLHEVLHVCFSRAGLDVKYDSRDEEENIVNAMAQQLYPILKENHLI